MIKPGKHKLLIALMLACICAPVLSAEPNEAETGLKIEISSIKQGYSGVCTKRPTHMAKLFINYMTTLPHFAKPEDVKMLFKTSSGQDLSQEQQDFMLTSKFSRYGFSDECPPGFVHFCNLYAVSQDDAKKTAELVIEFLTSTANARMQTLQSQQEELKKQITENKKKLQQKLATKEDADAELRKSLKERPYLLNVVLHEGDLVLGTDLPKLTEQMIQEMGKMLDIINVEIVGIQAKLSAIEEYKSKPNVSAAVLVRLDEILCEQSIELAGTLARKKQATDSRARYQDVYNLHKQWETAVYRYEKVRGDVLGSPRRLSKLKKRLADPTPDMLPPKVYQNKVTIYPVRVEVD